MYYMYIYTHILCVYIAYKVHVSVYAYICYVHMYITYSLVNIVFYRGDILGEFPVIQ